MSSSSSKGDISIQDVCSYFRYTLNRGDLSDKIFEKNLLPTLFFSFEKSHFEAFGFTDSDADLILQSRDKIKRRDKASGQKIRKFRQSSEENGEYVVQYVALNKIITGENSSVNLLDRIYEFKAIQCAELSQIRDAFEDRVSEFAIACLNARQNATIFLGVLDGKKNPEEHGLIAGVQMKQSDRHLVAEWMDECFFSTDPKLFYNTNDDYRQAVR